MTEKSWLWNSKIYSEALNAMDSRKPNLTLTGDYKIAYREACDYIAESLDHKIDELTEYIIHDDDEAYERALDAGKRGEPDDDDDYDDDKIESAAGSILEDIDLNEVRRADEVDGTEWADRIIKYYDETHAGHGW